jgi:hypothetical protein
MSPQIITAQVHEYICREGYRSEDANCILGLAGDPIYALMGFVWALHVTVDHPLPESSEVRRDFTLMLVRGALDEHCKLHAREIVAVFNHAGLPIHPTFANNRGALVRFFRAIRATLTTASCRQLMAQPQEPKKRLARMPEELLELFRREFGDSSWENFWS